jgi:hypothetical protein
MMADERPWKLIEPKQSSEEGFARTGEHSDATEHRKLGYDISRHIELAGLSGRMDVLHRQTIETRGGVQVVTYEVRIEDPGSGGKDG